MRSEMNDRRDTAGGANLAGGGDPIKARKKIAWEKSFGEPDGPATSGALKANAWKKDIHADFFQMTCGNVFALRL